MKQTLLNSNSAVVTRLLDGGRSVELRLPKGGRVSAPNRGFEIGEIVCYTLDATGRRIVTILPKEVADLKVAIAQDTMLQSALQEYDDDPIETDSAGFGQEDEGNAHQGGGVHREGMEAGNYYGHDPVDYEDGDGSDDNSESDPDTSGETAPDEFYVFFEHASLPELATDDDPHA